MSTIKISFFTFNRYGMTKLCLDWLLKRVPKEASVTIFDDGSDDEKLIGMLEKHEKAGRIELVRGEEHKKVESKGELDARLGLQRKKAVEHFLASDEDYLFLMDNDIIFGAGTLEEAVADYEYLLERPSMCVGSLSLHALVTVHALVQLEGKVFGRTMISGEANWLMSRDSIEKTGNHFGNKVKGFADDQLHALRKAGLQHYERTWPPYNVQHLGVGPDGSMIYNGVRKKPFWVAGPYTSNYRLSQETLLEVPGFDIDYYMECISMVGSDEGPLDYLKNKGVS
jgi:hypothetical protein